MAFNLFIAMTGHTGTIIKSDVIIGFLCWGFAMFVGSFYVRINQICLYHFFNVKK